MKNQRRKLTAIKGLLFAALLTVGGAAWAQVVGVVAHLSGPLIAKKANGAVKVLAAKSEVENGDTLVSEKNTYAQIKFIDHGEITLRPNTTFKIENFAYDAGKPENDSAKFDLVKGGLRSITGLLGKRNKEKFEMKTPSATIGIRGTTFVATYVPPSKPTADDMRINPNPSAMETGTQGKQPNPGTGTINRSPEGGVAGLNTAGKVSTGVQQGSTGQSAGNPAVLAAGAIGAARDLANGGAAAQAAAAQQLINDVSNSNKALMEAARGTGTVQSGTGSNTQGNGMAAQLQGLVNGGSLAPTPPAGGNTGPASGPAAVGQVGTPGLAPGLHLQVTDGAIVVTNNGGSQGFQAGQFGFVPSINQPPVIVPSNPAIQFVPPPSFNSGSGGPTASNGPGQGQATDCIVR